MANKNVEVKAQAESLAKMKDDIFKSGENIDIAFMKGRKPKDYKVGTLIVTTQEYTTISRIYAETYNTQKKSTETYINNYLKENPTDYFSFENERFVVFDKNGQQKAENELDGVYTEIGRATGALTVPIHPDKGFPSIKTLEKEADYIKFEEEDLPKLISSYESQWTAEAGKRKMTYEKFKAEKIRLLRAKKDEELVRKKYLIFRDKYDKQDQYSNKLNYNEIFRGVLLSKLIAKEQKNHDKIDGLLDKKDISPTNVKDVEEVALLKTWNKIKNDKTVQKELPNILKSYSPALNKYVNERSGISKSTTESMKEVDPGNTPYGQLPPDIISATGYFLQDVKGNTGRVLFGGIPALANTMIFLAASFFIKDNKIKKAIQRFTVLNAVSDAMMPGKGILDVVSDLAKIPGDAMVAGRQSLFDLLPAEAQLYLNTLAQIRGDNEKRDAGGILGRLVLQPLSKFSRSDLASVQSFGMKKDVTFEGQHVQGFNNPTILKEFFPKDEDRIMLSQSKISVGTAMKFMLNTIYLVNKTAIDNKYGKELNNETPEYVVLYRYLADRYNTKHSKNQELKELEGGKYYNLFSTQHVLFGEMLNYELTPPGAKLRNPKGTFDKFAGLSEVDKILENKIPVADQVPKTPGVKKAVQVLNENEYDHATKKCREEANAITKKLNTVYGKDKATILKIQKSILSSVIKDMKLAAVDNGDAGGFQKGFINNMKTEEFTAHITDAVRTQVSKEFGAIANNDQKIKTYFEKKYLNALDELLNAQKQLLKDPKKKANT